MKFMKYNDKNEHLELIEKEDGKDTLGILQAEIDCSLVQPVQLSNSIDVWIDEEGLDTANYTKINYIKDTNFDEVITLAGVLMFAGYDEEGATIGLSEEQIAYINNNIEITSLSPMEYLKDVENKYNDGLLG